MRKKNMILLVAIGIFCLAILYFFISQHYFKEREMSNMELQSIPSAGVPSPEYIKALQKAVKESESKK